MNHLSQTLGISEDAGNVMGTAWWGSGVKPPEMVAEAKLALERQNEVVLPSVVRTVTQSCSEAIDSLKETLTYDMWGMQAFMEVSDSPFKEAAVGGGLDPQEPMAVAVAVHPDMRNGDMASMTNRREAAGDDEEGRGQEQGYAASGSPSQPSVMDQEEEEEGRGTATAPDDFRRTASNEFRQALEDAPSGQAQSVRKVEMHMHFHPSGDEFEEASEEQKAEVVRLRKKFDQLSAEHDMHVSALSELSEKVSETSIPDQRLVPITTFHGSDWLVQGHHDDPGVVVLMSKHKRDVQESGSSGNINRDESFDALHMYPNAPGLKKAKKHRRAGHNDVYIRDCFSTDLRAAFSTNVRVVGTARKVDITDCSGVTFFIDKVVREVRALRCHLCKFVVGWHMPFFSLESCSDSIIVSNIADDAGQIIETAKCSGINLRFFSPIVHTRPIAALAASHEANSYWIPDDLNLELKGYVVKCRMQTKGGRPLDQLSRIAPTQVDYVSAAQMLNAPSETRGFLNMEQNNDETGISADLASEEQDVAASNRDEFSGDFAASKTIARMSTYRPSELMQRKYNAPKKDDFGFAEYDRG